MSLLWGNLFLILLVSCGETILGPFPNNNASALVQLSDKGDFQVTLAPLNTSLAGNVTSTGTLQIHGDQMTVTMAVSGSPPSIIHGQDIHIGTACPTLADDINQDGIIDVVEARARSGDIIIPLDADLSSQDAGMNGFPIAAANGNYNYAQSTSLSLMLADLNLPDTNPTDEIIKLPEQFLSFEGRAVLIHGIEATTALPMTVANFPGETPASSLPIACGIIVRVAPSTTETTVGTPTSETAVTTSPGETTVGGTTIGDSTGGTSIGDSTGGTSIGDSTGGTSIGDSTGGTSIGDSTGGTTIATEM
jgi:hypothetical protein